MIRPLFLLILPVLFSGADNIMMVGEDDVGCPDKASIVSAMKKPLDWTRTRDGFAYIPFAEQFDGLRLFDYGLRDDEKCRYLGDFLGAEFDRRSSVAAFVAPVPARIADRDGDFVCLQRSNAPPTARCLWASALPPSRRVRGSRP